ncbi:Pycsar system effector family protein [Streptomyces sp. NPDC001658]
MTAPTTPVPAVDTADRIHDHINQLNTMIGRCDTKAALLLALTGTSLAGITSVAASTRPPVLVLTVGAAGAALLLAAVLILLTVVRPNTDGPGWPRWPELDDPQLAAALAAERRLDEARTLARLARRKFAGVRRAVDCTRLGLLLLALAGVLAAL